MIKDCDTYEIDIRWFEDFVQHTREQYCLFLENHFI